MVVVAAWPAHAAITVIQSDSCSAHGATTCTTAGITTTSGNLFIISSSYCCDAFVSVADNKANVYVNAIAETSDALAGVSKARQDYKANGAGGASHTFTLTGNSSAFFGSISVLEVSGAGSSPLDKTETGSDDGSSTSHTTNTTATTSQANELLVGYGGSSINGGYANDGGAGWTEQTNISTDATTEGIISSTQIVSATGTFAYTFTSNSGMACAAGISTWKEGSATRQRCIGCGIDKKVIGQ